MDVQLIVVEDRDDIHQCHRVNGCIKLIDDQYSSLLQGPQDERQQIDEPDGPVRFEQIHRDGCLPRAVLEQRTETRFLPFSIQDIPQGIGVHSKQRSSLIQCFLYIRRSLFHLRQLRDQAHRIRTVDDGETPLQPSGDHGDQLGTEDRLETVDKEQLFIMQASLCQRCSPPGILPIGWDQEGFDDGHIPDLEASSPAEEERIIDRERLFEHPSLVAPLKEHPEIEGDGIGKEKAAVGEAYREFHRLAAAQSVVWDQLKHARCSVGRILCIDIADMSTQHDLTEGIHRVDDVGLA